MVHRAARTREYSAAISGALDEAVQAAKLF
jgi:hypothetical protein